MLTLLSLRLATWIDRRRQRSLLRAMLDRSDRELRDIGLTRVGIEDSLAATGRGSPWLRARQISAQFLCSDAV